MARRQVRDRFAVDLGLTVLCPRCRKRLGFVSEGDGLRRNDVVSACWLHDAADVSYSYWPQPAPLKNIVEEDWLSVRCRRCRFDWQGRQSAILGALANARARHARFVRLPA